MQILPARMDLPASRPPSLLNNNNSGRGKRTAGGADLLPQTALVKLTPPRLAKSEVRRKNLRGSENHQETETNHQETETNHQETETNQDTVKIDTTTMRTVTITRNAEKIAVVRGIVEGRVRGSGAVKGTARGSALSATAGAITIDAVAPIAELLEITHLRCTLQKVNPMMGIVIAAGTAVGAISLFTFYFTNSRCD